MFYVCKFETYTSEQPREMWNEGSKENKVKAVKHCLPIANILLIIFVQKTFIMLQNLLHTSVNKNACQKMHSKPTKTR